MLLDVDKVLTRRQIIKRYFNNIWGVSSAKDALMQSYVNSLRPSDAYMRR